MNISGYAMTVFQDISSGKINVAATATILPPIPPPITSKSTSNQLSLRLGRKV